MRSIREAQAMLTTFDREHWNPDHAGVETVRHIREHLAKSISGALQTGFPQFDAEIPGVCIEHALRLANVCACDITASILAETGEEPLLVTSVENLWVAEWIRECWRDSRIAGSSKRESSERLFVQFIASIYNLDVACEQAGHGKMPGAVTLLDAALQLMRYAVVFGPVGARDYYRVSLLKDPRAVDQLVAEFLLPFALRLSQLSQRFEYVRG